MTRFICILPLLACWAGVASAQTSAVTLTLQDAVARGLESSDRLADLTARADAARAVVEQREAARRPQAAVVASYTRTNHVEEFSVPTASGGLRVLYPDVPDNVRSRVDLQWPIYTGGRLPALQRAASGDADAALLERDAARADLKLEIIRAFWAVITARASRDVVAQAVARTTAHLADVRNQLDVGLVPPSDVFAIEAQLAHQQMLAIDADTLGESSAADFRRLVGLETEAAFELVADLSAPAQSASPPAEAPPAVALLFDTALGNRPERKALTFRIAAAGDRVTAAGAGHLPVVTALGGYDHSRPNRTIFPIQERWRSSWDIGVNLRWAVFDGGRTRAEEAEARAHRRSLEARLREFDAGVRVDVQQRLAELRAARASIAAAESGVRAAAEARRVIAERFAAGVATNTDVLNAQVALLQSELDRTRALAAFQLAAARLDRAVGRP